MKLRKTTLDTIDKLIAAPWFVAVGEPLDDKSVEAVHSWKEAMQLCLSHQWDDCWIDANNGITQTLDRDHRQRYQDWNNIVDAIDPHLVKPIQTIAKKAIREHNLPKGFAQVLVSSTRVACVESQYSDILAPGFYSEIASWYLVGRLPCGLTEEYPNGKSLIF